MRLSAMASRPGHCDARKISDISHEVLCTHDVLHCYTSCLANSLSVTVDSFALQIACHAQAFESPRLPAANGLTVITDSHEARGKYELAGTDAGAERCHYR